MKACWILCLTMALAAGCGRPQRSAEGTAALPDPSTFVTAEVLGVRFIPETGTHMVVLESRQAGQPVQFPIFVGEREAVVLNMKLARRSTPRPLTHDLALSLLTTLGGEIRDVVIDDVQEEIFLARIFVADGTGRLRSVDSRASDAIILGVAAGKPIRIAPVVFRKVGARSLGKRSDGPALDI